MDIRIEDDIHRVDFAAVARLLQAQYWCRGITQSEVEHAARHCALVLAAYHGDALAGYLRVVSDCTCFAYIMDVVVEPELRRRGIASRLVREALGHDRLKNVYQWMLRTRDAQPLYEKQGFRPLADPAQWMLIQNNRPQNRETVDFE